MSSVRRFLLLLCLVLFAGSPGFAAISANTVFEVRGTVLNGSPGPGSDTSGGGFVAGSGGTDRSQQNAAQVAVGGGSVTSSVTTTTITFTGGTYTVLAGDVGNIVQVISGTNTTPGFFQIASVGAGLNGTWVMDRNVVSAGTQTNVVANMGGALATLATLSGAMVASNKAFVTGAFTSTTTNTFAPGSVIPSATVPATRLIGYGTTRGDSTHATLTLSGAGTVTGILSSSNGFYIDQVDVNCGSIAAATGIKVPVNGVVRNCKISNFTVYGIWMSGASTEVDQCEVTGGTAAATYGINIASGQSRVMRCFIHDNACSGMYCDALDTAAFNLIVNNTGATSDGIQTWANSVLTHNTIHGNGRDGIRALTATTSQWQNWQDNIITNNGGFGITASSGAAIPASPDNDGNAFFSNTSGSRNLMDSVSGIYGVNPYTNVRDVTLTVSPYVGGTTGTTSNFALNNTAGGGAACRAVGSPGTFPGNTGTTGYLDMGAVQTRGSNTSPSAGGSPGIITAQ